MVNANQRLEQIKLESPIAETTNTPGIGNTIVRTIKMEITRLTMEVAFLLAGRISQSRFRQRSSQSAKQRS